MKTIFTLLLTLLAMLAMAQKPERQHARLVRNGNACQLIVDGRSWLIVGGELGNSSASSPQDVAAIFPKLKALGLNTVLVPAYWDLIEPEEGKFDFSTTDAVIDEANRNGLKVVFLWFGAWKNSMSCYAPLWFKKDCRKYPRARTREGKPLEIASAFSENVFRADSAAFSTWLSHTIDRDTLSTVIMLQIENEIGMLESARDHSALADREYARGVPETLTRHLAKNIKDLHPGIRKAWEDNGRRRSGSWEEVFGPGVYTDEYFMAWNYADYVERMAKTARRITSLPLYVNAAMNSRGRRPGEYPSAGPLAHLKDIWHAAAPSVDFLSPDLYDPGFTDWAAQYATPDNLLFIPEIQRAEGNSIQALYAMGEHDAIGLSPFSIENSADGPESANVKGYRFIRDIIPLIASNQGSGNMRGLYFDRDSASREFLRDGMKITASHYLTLPWDPRSKLEQWPVRGGILIRVSPREYILAGSGVVVKFEGENEQADTRRLGEDGFLESGAAGGSQTSGKLRKYPRIGIGSVEEVRLDSAGRLMPVRYFNGDETHQGRHVRIPVDDFKTLRIRLYDYE